MKTILSAKRLSNDLKNNKGSSYLKKTLKKYNNDNPTKKIGYNELVDRLRKDRGQINFVMAFNNKRYKNKSTLEKIDMSKSNIAKYSLVQVVKEMQQYSFGIRLIDISEM
jgi:wyosine [tRNA(Phe)-imidazoG37] synthetase (radical SAM superfamily)